MPPPGQDRHPYHVDIAMGFSQAANSRREMRGFMAKGAVHDDFDEKVLLDLATYLEKSVERKTQRKMKELIEQGMMEDEIDRSDIEQQVISGLKYPFVVLDDVTGGDKKKLKTESIKRILKLGRHVGFTLLIADQTATYLPEEVVNNIKMVFISACPAGEAKVIWQNWGRNIFPQFAEFRYWQKILTRKFMKMVLYPQSNGKLTDQLKLF